ncbi:cell division transport system permease protein [Amycolatopsis bartoniae]|uniref:Cell division protein FtsX n=1 Tax=Amycolatopsis bartoniae TaxID=941986 RepID=A0A8H9IXK1_9PSEU|nr:permease-like cell division protein FtsX [Amycolatopsis bartoniae]MBB2938769.1 cell division transport system permease protein [Amycolatopsis bartoniae]TVT11454.1 ABC transporter permease [Amycolatopsis bartoniae]GHF80029.1 cell division protein FtsX [Amycolatopsis bartoniae]
MRASFVFSEVFTGLRRNVTMTIAMIITTAVSLGMLGGGLLIVRTIDKMQVDYMADVEVSIYLTQDVSANDKDCSQDPCRSLRQQVQNNPAVESVVFENRDQAYERFKKIFQDNPILVQSARPEALPASLQIKLHDPSRSDIIVQQYGKLPGVDRVEDQKQFLDRFFGLLGAVRDGTFVIALIQALAALLLISNTVQISAFTRRTEVGIMRLVGATRWYTQLPFLLEAVMTGIVGWVLAIAGLIALKFAFLDKILGVTSGIIPKIEVLDIIVTAPWLLLASIIISATTGYVTLRLYVRH